MPFKQRTATKRPFHVMTKPIGPICNLDCEYCYYLKKVDMFPSGETFRMSPELLETYTKQMIAAQPGPHVDFAWQGGEPTLMGLDFFRLAVELQQKYLPPGWTCRNALQTNGTRLTPEWCDFLRDNGFLIGISIDGPSELHDRYRVDKGGAPTHHRVIRGLKLLQEHGVEHNVLCVVNNVNAQHPREVYRFFKEMEVDFLQFIPIVERMGGEEVSERSVAAADYGRFLSAIYDDWVRADVGRIFVQIFEECLATWVGQPASLCVFQETCGRAVAMEHNGDVFSCDHFVEPAYKLGNIREAAIGELMAKPEQDEFGEWKRDGLPEYCRRCPVRFVCNGGCPKNRFISTPDGEPGLNYLCAGYKLFFEHVDSTMQEMASLYRQGKPAALIVDMLQMREERLWATTGRNEPCPCGSGRKYKRCCWSTRN